MIAERAQHHHQQQQHVKTKKQPGEVDSANYSPVMSLSERIKLNITEPLPPLARRSPTPQPSPDRYHHHHGNHGGEAFDEESQLAMLISRGMRESVEQVCRDFEWGQRREARRIGPALQDQICGELIEETVNELGLFGSNSPTPVIPPFEACKRRLRFWWLCTQIYPLTDARAPFALFFLASVCMLSRGNFLYSHLHLCCNMFFDWWNFVKFSRQSVHPVIAWKRALRVIIQHRVVNEKITATEEAWFPSAAWHQLSVVIHGLKSGPKPKSMNRTSQGPNGNSSGCCRGGFVSRPGRSAGAAETWRGSQRWSRSARRGPRRDLVMTSSVLPEMPFGSPLDVDLSLLRLASNWPLKKLFFPALVLSHFNSSKLKKL